MVGLGGREGSMVAIWADPDYRRVLEGGKRGFVTARGGGERNRGGC